MPCTSEQTDGGVASQLEATLFGSYEVGYPKDIVRWSEELALKPEIERRILRIYAERTLIGSLDRAVQYFRGSALRKDALFVSSSGEDADAVSPIIAALRHCGRGFSRCSTIAHRTNRSLPEPGGSKRSSSRLRKAARRHPAVAGLFQER